jgi:tryptophan 2,3-dioxygenase
VLKLSPLLGSAFDALLESYGLTLIDLYRRGREFEELYQLAELLIEWDERTTLWKFHHVMLVERIIGGKVVGTQGTPVEVLGKRIAQRFYPELWEVRNQLTEISNQA